MSEKSIYRLDDLTIDAGRGRVSRGQDEIALPKLSYDLLLALVRAAPNLLSLDELMTQVWPGIVVSPETVTHRVKSLRDALGDDAKAPRYIVGLRGRGYQIAVPVDSDSGDTPPAAPPAPPPVAANLPAWTPGRRFLGFALAGAAVLAVTITGAWWHIARQAPAAPQLGSQQTIAILPFADLSEKQDQAYFADGITEEIRNLLGTIPELRVIGRTSSFQVRDRGQDIRKVGASLGAAYIVEGSVRRSGAQVRVAAQLIDARDGTQRWSRTFDRNVTDILRIQQDIATAAARALQQEVVFVSAAGSTHNSEAYDFYLRGLHAADRFDRQGFEEGIAHFRRALELDPTLVDAAVGLAETWSSMAAWGFVDGADGWARTRDAAKAALALDPKSARAHAVLGDLYLEYEWNWPAAGRELQLALELAPHDSTVLGQVSQERAVMGHPEEALRYIDSAIAIDPLNGGRYFGRNWSCLRLGRYADGEASARRALEISPTYAYGHYFLALPLLLQGKSAEALAEVEKETQPGVQLTGFVLVYHALGQREKSDAALARLEKEHGDSFAMYIAEAYAFRGEKDRAFEWLERALAQRDSSLFFIKQEVLFASLEDDPRYQKFLRRMNLPI